MGEAAELEWLGLGFAVDGFVPPRGCKKFGQTIVVLSKPPVSFDVCGP